MGVTRGLAAPWDPGKAGRVGYCQGRGAGVSLQGPQAGGPEENPTSTAQRPCSAAGERGLAWRPQAGSQEAGPAAGAERALCEQR